MYKEKFKENQRELIETKLEKIDSEMQSKRQCLIGEEEVVGKKLKGRRD